MTTTKTLQGVTARRLTVHGPSGVIVHPLDFSVPPGKTLAIIGESGSGKSMTARALTGLLPRTTSAQGEAQIDEHTYNLSQSSASSWQRVRGSKAVLLLQDPFTSLSPVIRCGEQIATTIRAQRQASKLPRLSRADLNAAVARRLTEVRLSPDIARRFPAELSGGMRQRVAIAAALAAEPRLLIADEPTTALDASTQGGVLDLLHQLQQQHHMSLILISHDLGVVSGRADDILVMRHGEVVERGVTSEVLRSPSHPYTKALLAANPTVSDELHPIATHSEPVLVATGVSKRFGAVQALSDASVSVAAGEIVAVVGESGSGKSTFARCIAGLDKADSGKVLLEGSELPLGRKGRTPGQMQIVFQDPYSTLNPSFTIGQSLQEAIDAADHSSYSVEELMRLVELDPSFAGRRPSQLSGGQRQRVAIARALAPNPKLLICDESVSALDVSVQAQVLELLTRFRDELDLAILFITHDLGVVARVANRAIVLQRGAIVEHGSTAEVLRSPRHPYTQMLVSAAEQDSIRRPDLHHTTTEENLHG